MATGDKKSRFNLDALGVCASSLCMIHCLVFPFVLAALPAWTLTSNAATEGTRDVDGPTVAGAGLSAPTVAGGQSPCCDSSDGAAACCATPTDFWIHVGLLATVAPLGLIAWGAGYRKHGVGGVLWLGMAGVILLCGAMVFGTQLFGGRGEQVMTVSGSIFLVSAHLWNRRSCRCCGVSGADQAGCGVSLEQPTDQPR